MVNRDVLHALLGLSQKRAYAPPGPPPGADPMAAAGGGMMPMDPAMGGAPPPGGAMPPAMPMDPMAGGMPPPGGMPMDPMAGGMPLPGGMPMDPAMAGAPPPGGSPPGGEVPIMLAQEDLMMLIEQAASAMAGGGALEGAPPSAMEPGPEEDSRITNKELNARIDGLEDLLAQIASGLGIEQPMGAGAFMEGAPPMPMATGMPPPDMPPPDMPGGGMGMPDPSMPADGGIPMNVPMGKMATDTQGDLANVLRRMRTYR